jgi:hypothetical protein
LSIREAIVPKASLSEQQCKWVSQRTLHTNPAIGEPM